MIRGLALLALAAVLAGCGRPAPAARAPRPPVRIVSINPCADALLRAIAAPDRIRAISHYSRDPRATSVPLDWAARHPVTAGTAEEILAMRPDLVVAGPHVALPTIAALKRMGVPILQLPVPTSIAESRAQVTLLGDAIGEPVRAAALSRRIGAAEARARALAPAEPVPALIRQGGGLVPGPGTLADALLAATGHRNMAASYGQGAWGVVGLEQLVARPPAILYSGDRAGDRDRLTGHPVLDRLAPRTMTAPFPGRLLFCGGPTIVAALDHLTASRAAHDAR